MRYLCVHCDHRFEHATETPPRCPRCMRVHGLERLEAGAARGGRAGRGAWIAAGAALGVAVVGYALWASRAPDTVSGEPPLRPLEPSELAGYLRAARVEARQASELLAGDAAVERFADAALDAAEAPAEAVSALGAAFRERLEKRAFVRAPTHVPRADALWGAAATARALLADGAQAKPYSLELAALAVAALRAHDHAAMVAEVGAFEGERAPPDPSGHFGYFIAVVPATDATRPPAAWLDPAGGRATPPVWSTVRVLTDVQAVAAALSHEALRALVVEGLPAKALATLDEALSLDRRSAAIRSARGAALLASGGAEEGARELEAAAELRPDAPRRINLASLALVEGDVDRASREVAQALEVAPDYAAAHAALAGIHLGRAAVEDARRELEVAERLDPELPTLGMLWANYHLRVGEPDRACERAAQAVERRGGATEVRLGAAQVYRAAGRYPEMRREAQAVLAAAPAERREAVRELLERVLGPTALDQDGEGAAGPEAGATPGFQLQGGSLLGGAESAGASGTPSRAGPRLELGDGKNLKLLEPGSRLRLDLSE